MDEDNFPKVILFSSKYFIQDFKSQKREKDSFFSYLSVIVVPFSSNELRTAGMEGKESYKQEETYIGKCLKIKASSTVECKLLGYSYFFLKLP